jgi:hypothetical protein
LIIAAIRRAEERLRDAVRVGRRCRILMDLAGPGPTGP